MKCWDFKWRFFYTHSLVWNLFHLVFVWTKRTCLIRYCYYWTRTWNTFLRIPPPLFVFVAMFSHTTRTNKNSFSTVLLKATSKNLNFRGKKNTFFPSVEIKLLPSEKWKKNVFFRCCLQNVNTANVYEAITMCIHSKCVLIFFSLFFFATRHNIKN